MYKRLGYPWIPPKLSENMGELEAAREGRLPQLVELTDIRGRPAIALDLVAGREEHESRRWRGEAKRLGRSYIAVTDHSHYLRDGPLEPESKEIDKVQKELGRFKLLKGVEANIKADGSVDVDDDVLADRDWVMASIHSGSTRT